MSLRRRLVAFVIAEHAAAYDDNHSQEYDDSDSPTRFGHDGLQLGPLGAVVTEMAAAAQVL
jgi:hypothetical protein